jgi:hypothetical protein
MVNQKYQIMQNKPNFQKAKNALTLATTMTTNYQLPTTNHSKQTQPVVSKRSASNHQTQSCLAETLAKADLPATPFVYPPVAGRKFIKISC